jgi:RNA polymerase sigma factor (sigma-70 family)
MPERTQAEQYLLDEIRRGSDEAWSQLVDRYQGRLTAYARRRAPRGAEAEDLVQDTLISFLRGLPNFRAQASIETYLFLILRRRLAELRRGHRISACGSISDDETVGNGAPAATVDPSASWYVRRDEQRDAGRSALVSALVSLVRDMQNELELHNLRIAELVFYAHWQNQRIATEVGADAKHVALLKHRWIKQLRDRVTAILDHRFSHATMPWDSPALLDSLLTEIWEEERPSCPKRSTIGGLVLGTLDQNWHNYVDWHINRLQCSFCLANLEDLQTQSRQDPARLHRRIVQSTVGFFRKSLS